MTVLNMSRRQFGDERSCVHSIVTLSGGVPEIPTAVTTLRLAEQMVPQAIFTHVPYGPVGDRYLFVGREPAKED